jgi:hypothetical protein
MRNHQNPELLQVQINEGLSITLKPDYNKHFLVPLAETARVYGVAYDTIRKQKMRNEFIEGLHFIYVKEATCPTFVEVGQNVPPRQKSDNLKVKKLYFTKNGIIRLGFFLTGTRINGDAIGCTLRFVNDALISPILKMIDP